MTAAWLLTLLVLGRAAPAGPIDFRPVPVKVGLVVPVRDRCVADHPPDVPLRFPSWNRTILVDPVLTAYECQQTMRMSARAREPTDHELPRPTPVETELAGLCNPSTWISFHAALCIARMAGLQDGIEPTVGRLDIDPELGTAVWTVVAVRSRRTDGWTADEIRVDAVDGTIRRVGGSSVITCGFL